MITLDDGEELAGKFLLPVGRSLFEMLNADGGFIEYQSFEGGERYIAKHALRAVKIMDVPKAQALDGRLRSMDVFDPFTVLGIEPGKPWQEVRQAYLELSKRYHPDRYCNADLPQEVTIYLASMARRINAAYAALEASKRAPAKHATRYMPAHA